MQAASTLVSFENGMVVAAMTQERHGSWRSAADQNQIKLRLTIELSDIQANRDHEVADVQGQTQKQQETFTPKEFAKAVYCHPAYLTYMQST